MSTTLEQFEKVQSEFTVRNGIIQNYGKFEGETLATPFYYNIMMDGQGDVIEIELEDRKFFDIDDLYNYVVVYESNSGFVSLGWYESIEDADRECYENQGIELDGIDEF